MTFKDPRLLQFWEDPRHWPFAAVPRELRRTLYRKLQMLDAAAAPKDLLAPPGNRLEKLKGDRAGQFSIRVNDRWRLCFAWVAGEVREVELVDYH